MLIEGGIKRFSFREKQPNVYIWCFRVIAWEASYNCSFWPSGPKGHWDEPTILPLYLLAGVDHIHQIGAQRGARKQHSEARTHDFYHRKFGGISFISFLQGRKGRNESTILKGGRTALYRALASKPTTWIASEPSRLLRWQHWIRLHDRRKLFHRQLQLLKCQRGRKLWPKTVKPVQRQAARKF